MRTFEYKICDPVGIHARPAGLLVKEAAKFESDIVMRLGDKCADCKKIFGVMTLGVKSGDTVRVEVSGTDENTAAEEMEGFFKENL